jgi:DNA modification methylase/ParB-like chromosome segregation protein Spo0J
MTVPPRLDPEFESLFMPLAADELAQLEASVLSEGIRDPLVVWGGVLLDGHNRFALAQKHGLEYAAREVALADRHAARRWIINNQLGRRNLTPEAFAYYLGLRFNEEKKDVGRPEKLSQIDTVYGTTRDRLADEYKVSPATVSRAGAFAEDLAALEEIAGPEVRQAVIGREAEITRQDVTRLALLAETDPDAAKDAIEKAIEGEPVRITLLTNIQKRMDAQTRDNPNKPRIYCADWRDWLASQPACDLLLTDPPYSTDIPDIESFAADWLNVALAKVKPTGRAYVCIGAYPEELHAYLRAHYTGGPVMNLANVLVWEYRNTLGPSPSHAYKQNWQAVLYFTGAEAPPLDCPVMVEQFSVQDINAPDGRMGDRYHAWQKPAELAERFIRHSTAPGDLVLDPFAGTGTFLLAAARLGREARGCDTSLTMIELAEQRGCEYA